MAYKKITDLTALATTPDDGDLFEVVDVSDTTDAATGTNKKVTRVIANPLATSSVYGRSKLSTAPTSAAEPIAVGDNDNRVSTVSLATVTSGQVEALVGGSSFGTPSSTNKYLTQDYTAAVTNPVVRKYYPTSYGSGTTQFDVSNPSGTTFRYTYDGTGTDPTINTTTFATGNIVWIFRTNMDVGNEGVFTVTSSGTNYFEVTNAGGVVETNKTISTDTGVFFGAYNPTWTKPSNLKYVEVEVQGGGGGGGGADTDDTAGIGGAGGGGGYSRELIVAASLGATETVTVGRGGDYGDTASSPTAGTDGGTSAFGAHCTATGGVGGVAGNATANPADGGTATGGDINISGSAGISNRAGTAATLISKGGDSMLGKGGVGNSTAGDNATGYGGGAAGAIEGGSTSPLSTAGIVIVREYYY